ncbi:MAG TPA: phenylalanine--tRNA ligase subunit beta [Gemmatimonadaceae bacterium]|nr:phenylalanine--tRNA ligase subunit beta [Gemmatimonadaceae bacterium]
MRLVISWLRDFVDITASAGEIADKIGLRGFEVASVESLPNHETHPELPDGVIDFEVTANRPDCLGVMGLAREVATAFDIRYAPTRVTAGATVPTGENDRIRVTIEDEQLGPCYVGAVADINAAVATPAWMSSRLEAAGVRPISAIVDITNYVLIEHGHPMHAFDLAKLAGAEIRVRRAKKGETITTLDNVDRKLDDDMLVIADRDRAQAIAGVMGGAHSEVSAATTAIVFESAYFKPASVRRTSKRLDLKTEASARFERGADVNGTLPAMQRAIALMEFIGAGKVSGHVVDRYPSPRQPLKLHLRRSRLALLLGVLVPDAEVVRILRGLGLGVMAASDGWDVVAPTYRVDLVREVDLIEEVGRHYGFERLETAFPALKQPPPPPDPRITRDELVRRVLAAAGLSEAVTFGFIEAKAAALVQPDAAHTVPIANPLSAKFETLRPMLVPGLVDAVAHNRRHGRRDVGLFEIGTRFALTGETRAVGIALTGAVTDHWSGGPREADFFDVKGYIERLADALALMPLTFEPATLPYLAPGQTAIVRAGGVQLGVVGRVAPNIVDQRGAPRGDAVFAAELDLDAAAGVTVPRVNRIAPLPRHPFVVRDLSIVVDAALPAEIIRGTIQAAGANSSLASVGFFDRYQGKGVPERKVSLSLRLTFQADRTLTDAEVQSQFDAIVAALIAAHGAVQR